MIFNYEPTVSVEDIASVRDCLSNGIASHSHISSFESALSEALGAPTITTSSGTASLHMALILLGIKAGDEVIVPATSFASTWNAVEYMGATPIPCDIDSSTWCICPSAAASLITPQTKALISVDLYGNPCNYDKILKLCKNNNIHLIGDTAESFGSTYRSKSPASIVDIGCTSFNLNKIITCCGGGALTTTSPSFLSQAKHLINQAKIGCDYDYSNVGYNYRLSSINASLGLSQLSRIKSILEKKESIFYCYKKEISNSVQFQKFLPLSTSNKWLVVVKFKTSSEKDRIKKCLIAKGIECKDTFKPLPLLSWFMNKYKKLDIKEAINLYECSLSLPSGLKISNNQIKFISNIINENL